VKRDLCFRLRCHCPILWDEFIIWTSDRLADHKTQRKRFRYATRNSNNRIEKPKLVPFNFPSTNLINCLRHVCDAGIWVCFSSRRSKNDFYSLWLEFKVCVIYIKNDVISTHAAASQLPCKHVEASSYLEICLFRSIKIISLWTFNVAALCQNKSDVIERKGFISGLL
jgi:hypothetical protein